MKIGFIGLGQMGVGMAANLLKDGHQVSVYNRTPGKAEALVRQGALPTRHIADVCRGDVVVTMLADDPALENSVLDETGLLENLGKGAIHLCMATISVALSERLTALHAEAGQHFVAAPVFGRPDAAAEGRLVIVAAGKPEAVTICQPLFETMGQKIFVVGDQPAMASLIKLSGNYLIASVIEALGEAMTLAGKAGMDRHQYLEILTSSLFSAPVYKTYGGLIADEKYEPAGFAAPLGYKDMKLTLAAAEALQVPMPLASLLRDRFVALLAQGGENLDWSAIAKLAAQDAGLKEQGK